MPRRRRHALPARPTTTSCASPSCATTRSALAFGGSSGVDDPLPPLPLHDPVTRRAERAQHRHLRGAERRIGEHRRRVRGRRASSSPAPSRWISQTGYRSTSFLTVPLRNSANRVIGVLQLLNAQDPASGAGRAVRSRARAGGRIALDPRRRGPRGLRCAKSASGSEIRELHVQIDEAKRARQVAEIADTDYFQVLQQKARQLRERS